MAQSINRAHFSFSAKYDAPNWYDKYLIIHPIEEMDANYLRSVIRGLNRGEPYWGQKSKIISLKKALAKLEGDAV